MTGFEIGDLVVDGDSESRDFAVVVNLPPVPARDWTVFYDEEGGEVTVAMDNPGYDSEAEVVVVAFQEELNGELPVEEPIPLTDLSDAGIGFYAFPPNRLEQVSEEVERLLQIHRHLVENNFSAELREGYVEVEGLGKGDLYRVGPSGQVEGDGPIRSKIEEVLANG